MNFKKYNHEERFRYLKELVAEFQDTDSDDTKEQILANLGNFSYDPINYEHFRKLNVFAIFLEHLNSPSQKLIEYAIGGICNGALDPENRSYIFKNGGINKVLRCLPTNHEETLLSTITALIFLHTPESHSELSSPAVVEFMERFQKDPNPRLSNLATIYLQEVCYSKSNI